MILKKVSPRKTNVSEYVRTLVANGYEIINTHRQPNHIEISCLHKDIFGVNVPYLFVFCQSIPPSSKELSGIKQTADRHIQNLVIVSLNSSKLCISKKEFFSALGGLIPTWRALSTDYSNALIQSSCNKLPVGYTGEAWLAFEETVADGFEFILGRRALRLGGNKRGKKVSDIFLYLPNGYSLLVDTKATATKFDASWSNLRALAEYTKDHKIRQKGYFPIMASILIGPQFKQDKNHLSNVANDFLSDTGIPLIFMTAKNLLDMTKKLSQHVTYRNKINWGKVFQRNGLYAPAYFDKELSLLSNIVK